MLLGPEIGPRRSLISAFGKELFELFLLRNHDTKDMAYQFCATGIAERRMIDDVEHDPFCSEIPAPILNIEFRTVSIAERHCCPTEGRIRVRDHNQCLTS